MSLHDTGTVGLLGLALDASALRQRAIAQNIANANVPGHMRFAVSFEDRLGAVRNEVLAGRVPQPGSLSTYRPLLRQTAAADGASLDMDMAAMSDNVLHHQTLLKLLNKHFSVLGTAISEGKR